VLARCIGASDERQDDDLARRNVHELLVDAVDNDDSAIELTLKLKEEWTHCRFVSRNILMIFSITLKNSSP
jgi:hypothetical protein